MEPLVSILIPCYNAENWLAETLESAIAQTWKNTEIIVVDDGSKDNSLTIAKKFEQYGVKVISQVNQGASAARNNALRLSQGDYIQFLDADDLLAPDKIKLQIKLLGNSNSNCVITGEWARFYKHTAEALFIPQPLWKDMSPVDWLICSWEGHWMMHPAAWLVPRHIIEKAGYWNEEVLSLSPNDDGEFFCRVVLASEEVKFCSEAKSYYRSGIPGSLSGLRSPAAWESIFDSFELCANHLLAVENSSRTRHACATQLQRFYYEIPSYLPELQKKTQAKVQQLGGSDVKPMGGPMFQLLSSVLGWKQARQIQHLFYRYGYRKAAVGWKIANFIERRSFHLQNRNL